MDMDAVVNAAKMNAYASYPEAIWAPIIFPLVFGLLFQLIVYVSIAKHWSTGLPLLPSMTSSATSAAAAGKSKEATGVSTKSPRFGSVEAPILNLMLSESFFGVSCFIQCVTNWAAQSYVGGASACTWQGFYCAYYTFASTGLCALTALAGSRSPAPVGLTVGTGIVVHVASALIAALPILGASGPYLFAHDYCQHNIESPLFAGLFIGWWLLCFSAVVGAAARPSPGTSRATRQLLAAIALYFTIAWLPSVLIPLSWLASGPVATSPLLGLYGVQAIFLHLNQLFVPLIFSWRLRAHMNMRTMQSKTSVAGAALADAKVALAVTPTPTTEDVAPASAPPSPPGSECGEPDHVRRAQVAPYVV